MAKMPHDWAVDDCRKAASIYRKHGVRVRIVRRRLYDTYLKVYRKDGPEGLAVAMAAWGECLAQGVGRRITSSHEKE